MQSVVINNKKIYLYPSHAQKTPEKHLFNNQNYQYNNLKDNSKSSLNEINYANSKFYSNSSMKNNPIKNYPKVNYHPKSKQNQHIYVEGDLLNCNAQDQNFHIVRHANNFRNKAQNPSNIQNNNNLMKGFNKLGIKKIIKGMPRKSPIPLPGDYQISKNIFNHNILMSSHNNSYKSNGMNNNNLINKMFPINNFMKNNNLQNSRSSVNILNNNNKKFDNRAQTPIIKIKSKSIINNNSEFNKLRRQKYISKSPLPQDQINFLGKSNKKYHIINNPNIINPNNLNFLNNNVIAGINVNPNKKILLKSNSNPNINIFEDKNHNQNNPVPNIIPKNDITDINKNNLNNKNNNNPINKIVNADKNSNNNQQEFPAQSLNNKIIINSANKENSSNNTNNNINNTNNQSNPLNNHLNNPFSFTNIKLKQINNPNILQESQENKTLKNTDNNILSVSHQLSSNSVNLNLNKKVEKNNNEENDEIKKIRNNSSKQNIIINSEPEKLKEPINKNNPKKETIDKNNQEKTPTIHENNNKQSLIEKDKIIIVKKIKNYETFTHVGFNGDTDKENNQDNFFVEKNFAGYNNYLYLSVCDGHGIEGHHVSEFIKEILPKDMSQNLYKKDILSNDKNIKNNIHNIIKLTFLKTNEKLILNEKINSIFSGTTCVSLIYTPSHIITANIGDSRAVLGRYNSDLKKCLSIDLSRDHKPTEEDEAKRILENGGRIKPFIDEDTGEFIGPQRVWIKDEEIPGLAMTRSFGDRVAATAGTISEPEIKEFNFDMEDKFIIIASDGIWEFISSEECVNMVYPFYLKNDLKGCCDYLYNESKKRWIKEEEVIDDITIILIFLE